MWQKDLNRLCLIQWWQYCNPHIPRLEGMSSEWYFSSWELQFRLAFLVPTILGLNYCNTCLWNLIYLVQTFLLEEAVKKLPQLRGHKSPRRKQLSENKTSQKKSSEFQPEQVFGHKQTPLGVLSTNCTWKVTKIFVWCTADWSQWPAEN